MKMTLRNEENIKNDDDIKNEDNLKYEVKQTYHTKGTKQNWTKLTKPDLPKQWNERTKIEFLKQIDKSKPFSLSKYTRI